MRICIATLDGAFDTGLAALLDTFELANGLGDHPFDLTLASPSRRLRTHHGFTADTAPLPARAPDLTIVPALACKTPETIVAALGRDDVAALAEALVRFGKRGRIAAACTGVFVLGHAGLLDGRRATTSWWLGPILRRTFPRIDVAEDELIVADGNTLTAGAALAHVDLALAIIRERSPDLAALVGRYLLLDTRVAQAPFVAPSQLAHDDELVTKFERWVRRNLREPFDLARAARAIGASQRTLQRRLRAVLGKPPIQFVQDLRVERAVQLLRNSRHSIDAIAPLVGYEDGATLRALLRKKLHSGVRELR
ncbi:MAG TPA: helix-turn-helix domain-containing protein [Kofleriaceae bacterium]